jgi:hypothetical protein
MSGRGAAAAAAAAPAAGGGRPLVDEPPLAAELMLAAAGGHPLAAELMLAGSAREVGGRRASARAARAEKSGAARNMYKKSLANAARGRVRLTPRV